MSTNQPHPSLASCATDRCLWLGSVEAASPRMQGDLWVVFHAAEGWTHLYRIDRRDPRTVHLLRCGPGDCRPQLAAFARARILSEAKAGERASDAAGDTAKTVERTAASDAGRPERAAA